jgi:hypothetical protein
MSHLKSLGSIFGFPAPRCRHALSAPPSWSPSPLPHTPHQMTHFRSASTTQFLSFDSLGIVSKIWGGSDGEGRRRAVDGSSSWGRGSFGQPSTRLSHAGSILRCELSVVRRNPRALTATCWMSA